MQTVTGVETLLLIERMFWSFPALTTFWSNIFKTLLEALNIHLQPNTTTTIFGITDRQYTTLRKSYKNIIAFTTLFSNRRILHLKIGKKKKKKKSS